jgi:hypothetical protein
MKKIYYLLAFTALAFSACQKEPALHSSLPGEKKDLTITLQASDYANVTGYPKTALTMDNDSDAAKYIPMILNAEYKNLDNGSTAAVTYTVSSLYFKQKSDSTYSTVAYTLTNADYLLLPGNKYTDFSLSQALQWMPYGFPVDTANELRLVNFTVYPSTQTPPPPYSYLFFQGAWKQIYTVQPAQYASVGLGKYNQFTTSNTEAVLAGMFNVFLKSDITIMDTIKKGDYEFVSFNYYVSSKLDYQRVKPLQYNGTDFVVPFEGTSTVNFIKQNGTWAFVKPLPVINYTLNAADITTISNSTFGTAALRANLASYGDFETSWAKADLQGAFILCLAKDITSPLTNTIYKVHYLLYSGGDIDTTLSFEWDGTKWVAL